MDGTGSSCDLYLFACFLSGFVASKGEKDSDEKREEMCAINHCVLICFVPVYRLHQFSHGLSKRLVPVWMSSIQAVIIAQASVTPMKITTVTT